MKIMFAAMGSESVSLESLSAMLKKHGHTVKLAFDRALFDDKNYFSIPILARLFDYKHKVIEEIVGFKPDLLGFSVFADNFQWALYIAENVKKRINVPVIFGNIHPTTVPEKIISEDCVDIICLGEGEYPLLELVESMQKGKIDYGIKNLWFKNDDQIIKNLIRPLIQNLDELLIIDKSLFEDFIPISDYYLTVTSRGCIYACAYCSQNFLRKFEHEIGGEKFLRERSVDSVINELKVMKEKYKFKRVDIKNNVLSGSREWTIEFLKRYKKEINVPFRIMGHPKTIDEEIAHKLKDAGCWHVQIGIESLNSEVRKEVLLRKESNEEIFAALKAMDKTNLRYSVDYMIGLPGEKEEDIIQAVRLFSKCKGVCRCSIFWLEYFPKLDITEYAYKHGLITDEDIKSIESGQQQNYLATGSVGDRQRQMKLKNYQLLFRMIPITPAWMIEFLLKIKLFKLFKFLPQTIILIIVDVIVSFFARDYYAIYAIKSYFWELKRRIKKK